jgi:hypothetical protein
MVERDARHAHFHPLRQPEERNGVTVLLKSDADAGIGWFHATGHSEDKSSSKGECL